MGFSQATFDFLRDLSNNNSKAWFDENRDCYEASWKSPALDFIDDVGHALKDVNPKLKAEARLNGSLRRINRDVRFSRDKSPYNPRLHMIFWTGSHPNKSPGLHIVLQPEGVGFGAGVFGLSPAELSTYRDRIMDPSDFADLTNALQRAKSVGCEMDAPDLARLPRGFDATGEQAALLRHKSYVARTLGDPAPASSVMGKGGVDWVVEQANALTPLLSWLVKP